MCAIPSQGASFGYHAGGWGKPPVDETGRPLYGDVFGTQLHEAQPLEDDDQIENQTWGELESEESEEESEVRSQYCIWTPLCRTRLSRTVSRSPWLKSTPAISNFGYVPKKHSSTSVRKCSQGTSWQDVLKAEKCIDVFAVTKAKSDWLDLPLRMQKETSCRHLLIFGIKLLLQKFDVNLAISNPRYLELFLDTLESSRWRGSTVVLPNCQGTNDSCLVVRTDTLIRKNPRFLIRVLPNRWG